MTKKYSSYKEHQLITENWRRFLTEDSTPLDPEAAAKGAETPKAQKLAAIAEKDPKVQAALAAVMDELSPAEGLNEIGTDDRMPGWLEKDLRDDRFEPLPTAVGAIPGAAAGMVAGLVPAAALEVVAGTPAMAALLAALNVSVGPMLAGGVATTAALGAIAGALMVRKANKKEQDRLDSLKS